MSNDTDNKEICKLININKDAAEFYDEAKEKAENPELRQTFSNLESLHNGVIVNLQQFVRAHGGDADADETMKGQIAQFWGEMKAKISNDVDETWVSELEEAEDRCLHSIEDAMENSDISAPAKSTLQAEYQTLRRSHDYMKALKETLKAA